MKKKWWLALGALTAVSAFPVSAYAAEAVDGEALTVGVNSAFVFIAAVLVIFMQAGFALLEAGSVRMKNAGHVAGKTILSFGVASIAFWAFGFAFGFGNGNGFFGFEGFFFGGDGQASSFNSVNELGVPVSLMFLFHLAFAGVSLAIAGGGLAERAKLSVYIVFGALFTIIIYPIIAHWVWGGGWLAQMGMQDFAGSTVVHLTGATAALVATVMLKPRLGKYSKEGKPNSILGHNQVLSVLGVIILWVGWFGFNPGSALTVMDGFFAYVALTTNIAAAAGGVAALLISWMVFGKADIPSMLNGVLAALVAITGSCAFVEPWAAVVIGLVAGVLTFFTAQWFEKAGVDDPVFAFSVHGVAGIWGALCTGFFATPALATDKGLGQAGLFYGGGLHQLGVQALGVVGTLAFVGAVTFVIFAILKATMGIRVTEEEEMMGLDISEHGNYGYPEQMKMAGETTFHGPTSPESGSKRTPANA